LYIPPQDGDLAQSSSDVINVGRILLGIVLAGVRQT